LTNANSFANRDGGFFGQKLRSGSDSRMKVLAGEARKSGLEKHEKNLSFEFDVHEMLLQPTGAGMRGSLQPLQPASRRHYPR
jgi:hypothetical protein